MRRKRFWLPSLALALLAQVSWLSVYQAQEDALEPQAGDEEEFIYSAGDLRNPFRPLFVPTPTPVPEATPTPTYAPYQEPGEGEAGVDGTPTPTPIPTPEFQLGGIFWDAKRPLAIVNNKMVVPGDTVADALVARIEKDAVILRYLGRVIKLERTEEFPITIE